ncbi:cyclic AMP-responsive element-binding protein 3-like protein 2 [Biomphalaria glabrata]|uniref:Cyclic AMP-responsive element-binding protein 3-like protein 2 n=1 Tax=Biomphalaria glabrata TaxID=6526 RepID=A0A9W3AJD7_BIOGL|nr:cyclic AMP-responsive element-binding protein 3-like protein 2 [Biomphalaria glabrata]KAI8758250.1 cyclic AMP-responsive element-binding protein 3-like protein 2 [Biomphalaria glabrata]
MDILYGHDRKLEYLEEPDDVDFFDASDIFHSHVTGFPSPDNVGYESDWLNSFLDDPVLNDKMMSDAMNPPCIKSEHSYSINDNEPGSPNTQHEDIDTDIFSNTAALDLTMKPAPVMNTETNISDSFLAVTTSSSTSTTFNISSRQPTIIVTTTSSASSSTSFLNEPITFPNIQIKEEQPDCLDQGSEPSVNLETILLPPTPPGSSGSDSDGSQSPQRSAPSSPIRQTYRHSSSSPLSGKPYSQPFFVNPISQSGVLILSEEEKRTLISEGYPIPTKLPLTKQEEKNLKKIRRKIKNKISAQESRRKKKEYLEALEKRVEAYNHENNDLKKKVENLENNNRSLLGQLQKLQSLVSKMPKAAAASATQSGTALMVLVFCFAVFLGSMSPANLNVGYSSKPAMLGFVQQPASVVSPQHDIGPRMMTAQDTSNQYNTPNLKSRMLMSVDQDDYCDDYRAMPWDNSLLCPMPEQTSEKNENLPKPGVDLLGGAEIPAGGKSSPDTTVVMVVAANMENTSDTYHQSTVIPDIKITHKEMLKHTNIHNMSTEMETA